MEILDLTLPTPEENLACEEALLAECEAGGAEVLRFWESPVYFAVLGYANERERELDVPACAAAGVPILRRITGGGTVLQGPGCLNYALILRGEAGALASVAEANRHIMERQAQVLGRVLGQGVRVRGHTDLAVGERKFSGNCQRRLRRSLLFHGSLLLDFDLAQVGRFLRFPSRQPDYRGGRAHGEFIVNVGLERAAVKEALAAAWGATGQGARVPVEAITELVRGKYGRREWNERI